MLVGDLFVEESAMKVQSILSRESSQTSFNIACVWINVIFSLHMRAVVLATEPMSTNLTDSIALVELHPMRALFGLVFRHMSARFALELANSMNRRSVIFQFRWIIKFHVAMFAIEESALDQMRKMNSFDVHQECKPVLGDAVAAQVAVIPLFRILVTI